MFDIAPSELMLVALVAIVFIGPKDLPRAMRFVGQWVGKGRTMARHFRTAMDDMVREAELHEMEQKWKAENERIMREHADLLSSVSNPDALPAPAPTDAEAGSPPIGVTVREEEPMLPLDTAAPAFAPHAPGH